MSFRIAQCVPSLQIEIAITKWGSPASHIAFACLFWSSLEWPCSLH